MTNKSVHTKLHSTLRKASKVLLNSNRLTLSDKARLKDLSWVYALYSESFSSLPKQTFLVRVQEGLHFAFKFKRMKVLWGLRSQYWEEKAGGLGQVAPSEGISLQASRTGKSEVRLTGSQDLAIFLLKENNHESLWEVQGAVFLSSVRTAEF